MSSSCFGSLDIRSPGVFTETFLDHYHLDICKSNAKTHKIISINRFGITCCYFSSRNIPAIALFAATFLSNLVLSRSNQCFGFGLDQSHCRKLHKPSSLDQRNNQTSVTRSFPFFCPCRQCSDPKSNKVSKQTDLTQPISLQA